MVLFFCRILPWASRDLELWGPQGSWQGCRFCPCVANSTLCARNSYPNSASVYLFAEALVRRRLGQDFTMPRVASCVLLKADLRTTSGDSDWDTIVGTVVSMGSMLPSIRSSTTHPHTLTHTPTHPHTHTPTHPHTHQRRQDSQWGRGGAGVKREWTWECKWGWGVGGRGTSGAGARSSSCQGGGFFA